jgi:uncharacterized protein YggU (UPF0235/DUF167 family)
LRYTVFVKFNPADRIVVYGDQITLSIKSKPERGKANRELIQKLADYFEIDKDKIRIISGMSSNKKLVEVNT